MSLHRFLIVTFLLKSFPTLALYVELNRECPTNERYELTKHESTDLQYFDENLLRKLYFPKELIDKANDEDQIAVNKQDLSTLCDAAKIGFADIQCTITEKKLLTMLSGLKYKAPFATWVVPSQYSVQVGDQLVELSDKTIIEVINNYLLFRQLLLFGWIRCSGNEDSQFYYRPRYIKQGSKSIEPRTYGPRFREIIGNEKRPEGYLFASYDFEKDEKSKTSGWQELHRKYMKIWSKNEEELAKQRQLNLWKSWLENNDKEGYERYKAEKQNKTEPKYMTRSQSKAAVQLDKASDNNNE